MVKTVTCLFFQFLVLLSFSQSTQWTGNAPNDNKWGTEANWSNGVPNATTDAVISPRLASEINVNIDASCKNLTIKNNSNGFLSFGLNNNLSINGNLDLSTGKYFAPLTITPTISPTNFTADQSIEISYDVTGSAMQNWTDAWLWLWLPDLGDFNAPSNINPAMSNTSKTIVAKFTKSVENGKHFFKITLKLTDFTGKSLDELKKVRMLLKGNDWVDGQTTDYTVKPSIDIPATLQINPKITPANFTADQMLEITYDVTNTYMQNWSEAWIWLWLPDLGDFNAPSNVNPAKSNTAKTDKAKFSKTITNGKHLFKISLKLNEFTGKNIDEIKKVSMLIKRNGWNDGKSKDTTFYLVNDLSEPLPIYPEFSPVSFKADQTITITYDVTNTPMQQWTEAWLWLWLPDLGDFNAPSNINPAKSNTAITDKAKFTKSVSNGKHLFTITLKLTDFTGKKVEDIVKASMLIKGNDWSDGQSKDYTVMPIPTSFDPLTITPLISPAKYTADQYISIIYDVTGTPMQIWDEAWIWLWLPDFNEPNAPSNINPAKSDISKTNIAKFSKSVKNGKHLFKITLKLTDFTGKKVDEIKKVSLLIKGNDWSNGKSIDFTTSPVGKTLLLFEISDSNTLKINGNMTKSSLNVTIDCSKLSTVELDGTTQSFPSGNYGNLILSGSSTKTLSSGNLTIAGKLTINSGVTFSTPSGTNTYTFEGGITNNGTFTSTNLTVFGGSTTQVINGSQPITFADQVTFQSNTDIDTDVTFSGAIISANKNISFAKNVSIANTFTNTGTVTFDGSSAQSISGAGTANLNNLTISNTSSSTATINNANTNITGTLTLSANSRLNANGKLTLRSNGTSSSNTARVATIPASATLSGNVIYQRYVSGAKQWHNIGLPISANKNQIDYPLGTGGRYLSRYNEATPGNINQGWENSSNFSTLDDTRGYSLWTASTNPTGTIAITGPLNTGNVSLNVSYTDDTTQPTSEDGWNLVSNPYASQIDWGSAGWTKTNIGGTAYVWVPSGATNGASGSGSYTVINGPGVIASGQAFWVHANAASPVLTATQSVKTSASATFSRTETLPDDLTITMHGNNVQDVTRVRFMENAVEEFDNQHDGYKLRNVGIHNLSSLTTLGLDVSINSLPFKNKRVVLLNIRDVKEGNYSMIFDNVSSFGNYGIILVDKFVNEEIELFDEVNYKFRVTSDPLSYGKDRFELRFVSRITSIDDERFEKNEISLFPNPIGNEVLNISGNFAKYNEVSVFDNKGRELLRKKINRTLNNIEIDMSHLNKGMYFIHLESTSKRSVQKILKY